jgi:hypothetical protein
MPWSREGNKKKLVKKSAPISHAGRQICLISIVVKTMRTVKITFKIP